MAVTAVRRADALRESIAPFLRFFTGAYSSLEKDPDTANFAVGNPHEIAMPSYVDALRRTLEPQDKDWFAYKLSEPEATSVVARTMSNLTGLDWDPADVNMTNGGFAAIAVSLKTLLEPGDEAIYLSPPWFFYEHADPRQRRHARPRPAGDARLPHRSATDRAAHHRRGPGW